MPSLRSHLPRAGHLPGPSERACCRTCCPLCPADEGRDCTYYAVVGGEQASPEAGVLLDSFEPPPDFVISEFGLLHKRWAAECCAAACAVPLWTRAAGAQPLLLALCPLAAPCPVLLRPGAALV